MKLNSMISLIEIKKRMMEMIRRMKIELKIAILKSN
jgi:hypothetical protein